MKLKKYSTAYGTASLSPDDEGEWVRTSDVEALEAEYERAVQENLALRVAINSTYGKPKTEPQAECGQLKEAIKAALRSMTGLEREPLVGECFEILEGALRDEKAEPEPEFEPLREEYEGSEFADNPFPWTYTAMLFEEQNKRINWLVEKVRVNFQN